MRKLFWSSGTALLLILAAASAPASVTFKLDPQSPGRTFEGIGGVSAGASSRLLVDYPEPQRSEILDYLFKPGYGASLQHLKVEVGGDINSTDGCEPSHMHARGDENYQRGYEWWLMEEAKKRNPQIVLDCLAWGAPAWIGNGNYYSQDMADYLVKFIQGAQKEHGLAIAYVGIWNERPYNASWIKLLRRTLDRAGLTQVKIAAADQVNKWNIVDDLLKDSDLKKAISAVAVHYPHFASTQAAQTCGLPLWSSEDGPWRGDWNAAETLARTFNRNYVIGKITATEIWSPVSSYYDNLPLPSSGLMRANTPWSGSYEVQPAIWAAAHTTQFTEPGWRYLDRACAMIDGGSVVALMAPDGKDYSLVLETTEAKVPQVVSFQLMGDMPSSPLHVWRSDDASQFIRQADIQPAQKGFQITLEPGAIYSVTTLSGQGKGTAAPPPGKPFPFPYTDDFESYPVGSTPKYSSDFAGIFAVVDRADGKGHALGQIIAKLGIKWAGNAFPETFLGSSHWTDCAISVDTLLDVPGSGFVSLFGRVGQVEENGNPPSGYWLKIGSSGKWELSDQKKELGANNQSKFVRVVLTSGSVSFASGQWHRVKLQFAGNYITFFLDGRRVGQVENSDYASGMAGIGSGWNVAQFDNLAIGPVTTPSGTP